MSGPSPSEEYTLRVAYLHSLVEQRKVAIETEKARAATLPPRRPNEGGSRFFSLDLAAPAGRDKDKSSRYPERLLKLLDGSLQRIASRNDLKYKDSRFCAAIGAFRTAYIVDKTVQRQLRESRSLEELILAFAATSTKSLRKDDTLPEGAWKEHLDTHIACFLDVLSDALACLGSTPADLRERLESYRTKLKSAPLPPPAPSTEAGHGAEPGRPEASFDAVRVACRLFSIRPDESQRRIAAMRQSYTLQAAVADYKLCLQRLNTERPFLYTPGDFDDPAAWTTYKNEEVSSLSKTILDVIQSDPSLAASDRSSKELSLSSLSLEASDKSFTYIPAQSREAYREVLDRCLDCDLAELEELPEDHEVSLGILSPDHVVLLGECATRWRLPSTFRSWTFLDAIQDRYERGLVPPDCVFEAVAVIGRLSQEFPVSTWATSDRRGLENAIVRRNVFFLADVLNALVNSGSYMSSEFADAVASFQMLDVVEAHPALSRLTASITDQLRQQAYEQYIHEASERFAHEGGKNRPFALGVATWIEKSAKKLSKRFPDPIAPDIDLVSIALHQHLSLWLRDLEDAMAQVSAMPNLEEDIEEALGVYRRAKKLLEMGRAFQIGPIHHSLSSMFEPVIQGWLQQTATKTKLWADNALAMDNFSPDTENGPSSSVTDLFDSFRSAAQFLLELDWEDQSQLAGFATRLAKTLSLSLNEYCNKIESLFANDMQQTESVQTSAKQKAWIEKAKKTIAHLQGERKLQAFFNFTPASCVKLNNIDSARQQLDRLYQELRVDELAAYQPVDESAPVENTFLFTVKIVLAEGLAHDGNAKAPDAFVVLSDEHGNRYAKTRTVYEDFDPRWDETFDVPVRGPAWFMVTVRHRLLAGKHELLGRALLLLDPQEHADLASKDVLLPLDSAGQILVRLSVEGERDDMQFHFGRAFRWLKRTEGDMVRVFVDKMTPVLRHTLSRASIKSVLKPGGAIDYQDALRFSNDAIGRLSAAYRNALGNSQSDHVIPLLSGEQKSKRGPTDPEIEVAIHPLFDYLDTNNHTLASHLSPEAMKMVMTKLWKQILMTIESLIVPPLGDKPSPMRALTDGELDIALRWLKFLRDFLYAGGDPSGVPLDVLQNHKFNEIMSIRIYYDWSTDDLMEECIRGFQDSIRSRAMRPSKSIVQQRNLGTIRARKSAKKALPPNANHTEMIMRILRMRPGTQDFLAQQIQTFTAVRLEGSRQGTTRKLLGRGKRAAQT